MRAMPRFGFLSRFRKKGGATARAPAAVTAPPEPRPVFPDAGDHARVTLYIAWWDSDSRRAMRVVQARGWPTHLVDVGGSQAARAAVLSKYQRRLLPVVLVDGQLVGGRVELEALRELPATA